MRVFVTGAGGFIGSQVVERLRADDTDVIAPSRAQLDYRDADAVTEVLRSEKPDVLIHLAGRLDSGNSPEAWRAQWNDTFLAGKNVLEAASHGGVRRILAVGSMSEMGSTAGVLSPDTVPVPREAYGLCKSWLLEFCHYLARVHGVRIDWFRPTTIYGPGQVGPMLVPSAFATALGMGTSSFTSGEQRRDFIFIDDVVDWIQSAVGVELEGSMVAIHHLGSSAPVPVRDVLGLIEQECGVALPRGTAPRREGEPDVQTVPPYDSQPDPIVDWKPQVGLTEGLRRTADWWRERIELALGRTE